MRVICLLALLLFTGPAVAQEPLAVEGWRSHTSEGTIYYGCASPICAAGSEVSYKRQQHRATVTLLDFETHHRWLSGLNRDPSKIDINCHIIRRDMPTRAFNIAIENRA